MPSSREHHAKKPNPGHGVQTDFGKDLEEIDIETGKSAATNKDQGKDHSPDKHGGVKGMPGGQYTERKGS